jgi:gluconokinase
MMPDAAEGSASTSLHDTLHAPGVRGAAAPRVAAGVPAVVMGVAGCGKSSLAEALSRHFSWPMIEGDAFHRAESRDRMQAGIALTDSDRAAWLAALGRELASHPRGAMLACSALKRSYRDMLRAAAPGLRFVFLDITPADAQQRVTARAGEHFFHPGLVQSQFETLEPPLGESDVLRLDATRSLFVLCESAAEWLTRDIPFQPVT